MSEKKQLSILEFSRLTGIKRDSLRFYDRIGLLKPEMRGANGYRYYTRRQLGSAYLIGSLRLLEVGLDDIREYSADRTPEKMLDLFEEQEARIQAEMERLRETSEIMNQYAEMAQEALSHKENEFELRLKERKRERIFLCPPVSPSMNADEGEIFAYEYANSHGINLGHPLGVMITRENLFSGEKNPEYQYYLRTGKKGNAWKPDGLYAVAYGRNGGQEADVFYLRLLDYIRAQDLEPIGGAYFEFLLDEIAVQNPEEYFGRIEIPVKRR